MSKKIFDSNVSYVERFLNNQSKRIEFPSFKYLDAKFHPKLKDHIVVLSSNEFPSDVKMTYCWDGSMYGITDLDTKYPENFNEALEIVEKERDSKGNKLTKPDTVASKRSSAAKSPTLNKTDALLEETKGLGIGGGSQSDSYDYDGGESDLESAKSDDVKSQKSTKPDKKPVKGKKGAKKAKQPSEKGDASENEEEKKVSTYIINICHMV
jgi:hypothetical protein